MLLQEDIDAISRMTGLPEPEVMVHETLGAEYTLRQRMYHAAGYQGVLPVCAMIDMLRFLGFTPAALPAPLKAMEIRWEDVRIGTRVIVAIDDDKPNLKLYGVFKGKTEPGYLAVCLDGAAGGFVDEVEIRRVVLAPEGTPEFVAPEEPATASLQGHVEAPESAALRSGDDLPADEPERALSSETVDRSDPEGRVNIPKMTRDWSGVDPGDPVLFRDGDQEVEGEWIEDGPTDGHVTILVGDTTRVVAEELVEV